MWRREGLIPLAIALSISISGCSSPGRDVGRREVRAARIDTIATFPGCAIARLQPWSPRGTWLVLNCGRRMVAIDARDPDRPPRELAFDASYVYWSPDGRWAACLVRSPGHPLAPRKLVAMPVAEGRRDTLYEGDGSFFHWADDGNIYDVESTGRAWIRHVLSPPPAWRAEHPALLPARPTLVRRFIDWRLGLVRFTATPTPKEERVPALDSLAGAGHLLLLEPFADGERFLVAGLEGRRYVVDVRGRILASLGSEVQWRSASAAGRFVVGMRTEEDGENVRRSRLYVGDTGGRWRVEIAGTDGAIDPRMSRESDLIVFRSLDRSTVTLGRLVLEGTR